MVRQSVTMSSTAPNRVDWFSARAAMPSKASSSQDTQYSTVQYLGWVPMKMRLPMASTAFAPTCCLAHAGALSRCLCCIRCLE